MQYSPKLKKAMEQIKKLLTENDITGLVILHTPGFSEYLNHCTASYSCAKPDASGIRLELKAAEVGKERARELANGTFNMVHHFATQSAIHAQFYMDMEEMLRQKWSAEITTSGGHTSHGQQNN
jgi:hypothetical protein